MVSMNDIQAQFRRLHVRPSFFARAEVRELQNILLPEEQLTQVVMGWYDGGFALLCCTDQRVLLVDKKFLFLTLEDLRYDMIAEVMYQYRLMDASIILASVAKKLKFNSWNQGKLRQLTSYVQQRVMEVRKYSDYHMPLANMLDNPTPTLRIPAAIKPIVNPQAVVLEGPKPLANTPDQLPVNPYQVRSQFRRRRLWRFITSSQLGPH